MGVGGCSEHLLLLMKKIKKVTLGIITLKPLFRNDIVRSNSINKRIKDKNMFIIVIFIRKRLREGRRND